MIGICNGFQILTRSGLLPGALMRNRDLKYVCKPVYVRVENADTPFTNACRQGDVLVIPIGHMEGNYFCDDETLAELHRNRQIAFRYCTAQGEITGIEDPDAIGRAQHGFARPLGVGHHAQHVAPVYCTMPAILFERPVGIGSPRDFALPAVQ